MAGPNRFLNEDLPEKKGLEELLGYLRNSMEKGTEVDLSRIIGCIDNSKFSSEELEEIRDVALSGARKYCREASKEPKDKSKQISVGAYAIIANYAAAKSSYRHEKGKKGLEFGD